MIRWLNMIIVLSIVIIIIEVGGFNMKIFLTIMIIIFEVGGFIALILGISFMDLMRVAEFLKDKMMNKIAGEK